VFWESGIIETLVMNLSFELTGYSTYGLSGFWDNIDSGSGINWKKMRVRNVVIGINENSPRDFKKAPPVFLSRSECAL